MNQEQQQFLKRIQELEESAWQESRFIYTDFLNEAEYSDVLSLGAPACGMQADGGYEGADRVMVRFGDPQTLGYDEPFPITVLHVLPLLEKFADALTHRDFLGAVLNLGIDRRVTGDILVKGSHAYVMCESRMADYLMENLTRVRHTAVHVEIARHVPDEAKPRLSVQEIQISSNRLDAVIAQVFRLSRSASQDLLRSGQVFINGRAAESSSAELRENDTISVRHYGKFRYDGAFRTTRKGKLCARIGRYV